MSSWFVLCIQLLTDADTAGLTPVTMHLQPGFLVQGFTMGSAAD